MEWTQFIILSLGMLGLFAWNRAEARADARHFDAALEAFRLESSANIKAFQLESGANIKAIQEESKAFQSAMLSEVKDFHGRLCSIEERNKAK